MMKMALMPVMAQMVVGVTFEVVSVAGTGRYHHLVPSSR